MTSKKYREEWVVRAHGPIEQLAENLWWTWGSLPRARRRRSMVVARRSDGLVIHNPIALDDQGMLALCRLGEPAYLIVPSAASCIDAAGFKARFPRTQVFTTRAAHDAVAKRMRVDGIYEDFPQSQDVRLQMLQGVGDTDGAMVIDSSDGVTVVLNDAVVSLGKKRDALGFLAATLLGSAHGAPLSRFVKLMFVKNKKALREDLERFADDPDLVRFVGGAHSRVAIGPDAASVLRRAATSL